MHLVASMIHIFFTYTFMAWRLKHLVMQGNWKHSVCYRVNQARFRTIVLHGILEKN